MDSSSTAAARPPAASTGRRSTERGFALAELIAALALAAALAGIAAVSLANTLDKVAVRLARDGFAAQLARARTLSLARGSARVIIDPGAGRVLIEAPAGQPAAAPMTVPDAIELRVDGAGVVVALDFDRRGVGLLANRTFRFRRGNAESRLTTSTYGRPRRW